jgi:HD-GYP domain-containing protein (c-di-GMP phosphodiesterase class II)
MRFGTRVFLLCFVPLAVLLTFTSWIFERVAQNAIREGMGASLRDNQRAIGQVLERGSLRNSRYLRVVGENAALKAGIQLMRSTPEEVEAQLTVEDQLNELCEQMGFDLLMVSAPDGTPLAGVARKPGAASVTPALAPISPADLSSLRDGSLALNGRLLQIASVPVNFGEEDLARLSVGEYFDLKQFSTPVALLRAGTVIASSLDSASAGQIEESLRSCNRELSCDARIAGSSYISLPVNGVRLGPGYSLRSFENLDSAMAPINGLLRRSWLTLSLCALVAALAFGANASRSIAGPIASMARRLKTAEKTGLLPQFPSGQSSIREVRELMESFNRAATAVRESRDELHAAYIEFVGSLASALDARDCYTAGHSHRVSRLSCATADAMHLDPPLIERLRIGALLHDIGKIGVADEVLRKPGKLTSAEFAMIQLHPLIGRRILEGVNGFAPFLEAVELHHENWDGSGYPHGQKGEQTPIEARIIHVADAYDAMTTHRPYRQAMAHEQAIAILRRNAATQFDPQIVDVFIGISIFEQGEEFIPAIPVELAEAV